jgi:GTP-binding protein
MVNEMPGTTRDTVDVLLHWHKRRFRIVDTAGMRRPGRVASAGQVESVSVVLAMRAMARADVVVLVVDATEGAGDREGAIAGEAEEAGCGIVITVNKWDLMKGRGQDFAKAFDDKLRFQLKVLEYAPIVRLSALTGDRTGKLLEGRSVAGPTAPGADRAEPVFERVTAAYRRARRAARSASSTACNWRGAAIVRAVHHVASELHFSYERYLANQLRETFGFEGTPIRITVRRRAKGRGQRAKGSQRSEVRGHR